MCQIEMSFNAIEPVLYAIQSIIDTSDALIDSVKASALNSDLGLHVSHLCHDMTQRGFET